MIKKLMVILVASSFLVLCGCQERYSIVSVSYHEEPEAGTALLDEYSEEIDISESILGAVYDNTNLIDIVNSYFDIDSFILPLANYTVSSRFGPRESPGNGVGSTNHKGMDLSCPEGTNVFVTMTGIIYNIEQSNTGYGNNVVVYHGEMNGIKYYTRYAHLSRFANISVGQVVHQGDVIAFSGNTGASTGPHLHYEILENGVQVDPEVYTEF